MTHKIIFLISFTFCSFLSGDELEHVYEKIKINRTKLKQGEKEYTRLHSVETKYHFNITELFDRHAETQTDNSSLPILKMEMYQLEKELFQERAKIQLLREESKKFLSLLCPISIFSF